MDELTKLCDELESCKNKLCYKNEIICAKRLIDRYYGNDKNGLLKLKAQINKHNADDNIDPFSYLSITVSIITLCLTILAELHDGDVFIIYALIFLAAVLAVAIIPIVFYRITNVRKKWRKYIEVAIEDFEKESR